MSMLRWKQKLLPMGNPQGGGGKGGGGGGGSQQPVTQQVNNTSIPTYAQPYVETMLGAAQQQIFNYDDEGNVTSMKPYTPYSANPADYIASFSPLQQQAQSNVANMQVPGQYNTAMNYAQTAGLGALGTANPAAQYGGMGANFGTAAANLAPQAQQYGQTAADIGTTGGLGYGAAGMQAGRQGEMSGLVGQRAGMSYGQNATNPSAVQAYMNPYLQATLDPAMQLQAQQFGQLNAQNQSQATQQGAFGGGRQAIMQGLNQQNQMLAQNQLVGNAYNQAYNTANQNMQQAAALGMQGAGLGIQGAQAGMQGAGLGLQGVNAAMQGQQTGLQGLQQAGNLYGQGMQGAQIGLQGVGAQQAAYGQLGAQGTNLANIAGAQTQTALGINQAQQAAGAAQQAQQQNIINQAVQNYATEQQYPMTQLANMSALLRGLPMQQTTTQTYQAAPSAISTLGGLGATALGAYGAAGGFKGAKGGLPKDFEKVAKFDVGGAVEADLENMDDAHLAEQAKTSPSTMIRQQAAKILAERQVEKMAMAKGVGATPAQSAQMAGGGIVAFAEGDLVDEGYSDTGVPLITPSYVGNLAAATPGSREFLGLPSKEEKPKSKAKTDAKPDELGRYIAASEPAPKAGGLGTTAPAQTRASAAPAKDDSALGNVKNYYSQLKDLIGVPEDRKELTEQIKADREELKADRDQNLWRALMVGGAKAMESTSPFANVGIGKGFGAGVEEYAKGEKELNDQLNKLRAGEVDLAKLSNSERTNLLHYAVTGAVSDANMRTKMQELKEIAATRAQGTGQAALARQDAAITARAKLILGNNPMPTEQDVQNAIDIATRQVTGKDVAGGLPKGVVVKKVG